MVQLDSTSDNHTHYTLQCTQLACKSAVLWCRGTTHPAIDVATDMVWKTQAGVCGLQQMPLKAAYLSSPLVGTPVPGRRRRVLKE
jgi:hypothetical protein